MKVAFLYLLACSLTCANASAGVITGSISDFTSPDDLLLDPANTVIAVDVGGDVGGRVVNGVTFLQDGGTAGTANATLNFTNTINGWGTPAPAFTGIDPTSVANFNEIMHDIRWDTGTLNPSVDITGLTPGTVYKIQLLFSENGGGDRHFDIGIDGTLVVDDFFATGTSNTTGRVYTGAFDPGADGILNIIMGVEPFPADPNNTPVTGTDNNPLLQALIVSEIAPSAPTDITLSNNQVPAGIPIGDPIGNLASIDPDFGTHTYALVAGLGDTDNASFQITGDQLETAADLSTLGGTSLSIRVSSTDTTPLSFEKILTVEVLADSDGDNLDDSWELTYGTLPDFTGLINGPGPGAGTGDFDGDRSADIDELNNGTDPSITDTDTDGSSDGDEATNGTNPLVADTDGDNLNDGDEAINGTNPLIADTDGDTLLDGDEILNGTDPTLADTDNDSVNDNNDADPNDPNVFSFTDVIVGQIIEFGGPDDLHLDPATAVIAVNSFGTSDADVNGITFLGDEQLSPGSATANGVTVATTSSGMIADWSNTAGNTPPTYSGADTSSTLNLEAIMASIRWQLAPSPMLIDISGLTPGLTYEIQILTNETGDRARQWDIAVNNNLVVDNYTSEGAESIGVWTPNNSFAYVGEFETPADGLLSIQMVENFGGIGLRGLDQNPIIQAIIVHQASAQNVVITDIEHSLATNISTLTWDSGSGVDYTVEFSTNLMAPWIEVADDVTSQGASTTYSDPTPRTGPKGFYRVSRTP